MRRLWLVVLCSCSQPTNPTAPVDAAEVVNADPLDPLLGPWDGIDNDGAPGDLGMRATFAEGGTYEYRLYFGTSDERGFEAGTWKRIDEQTIEQCPTGCDQPKPTTIRIEGVYLSIGPVFAVNGGWSWSQDRPCYGNGQTYGGRWVLQLGANGSARQSTECSGPGPLTYFCDGTWTTKPLGVTVTYDTPVCPQDELFRLSDAAGGSGFRRAE
jgi:hypothetical protein